MSLRGFTETRPVNIALDYLFDDFYNAVMTPDDDEAPAAGGPTEPDAANAQAGPEARVDGASAYS